MNQTTTHPTTEPARGTAAKRADQKNQERILIAADYEDLPLQELKRWSQCPILSYGEEVPTTEHSKLGLYIVNQWYPLKNHSIRSLAAMIDRTVKEASLTHRNKTTYGYAAQFFSPRTHTQTIDGQPQKFIRFAILGGNMRPTTAQDWKLSKLSWKMDKLKKEGLDDVAIDKQIAEYWATLTHC